MTEVVVTYSYVEMFGLAEARIVFDADEQFLLADGRTVSVLDLHRGMSVVMADGSIGTLLGNPERRYDIPVPPLPAENGLWTSRVIGRVKHTAHEVIEFGWGGQTVRVTPGHEVWSADRRGWVWAYELRKGELIRVAGNVVAPAESIRRVPGLIEVFGIEVEYFHNYFVGSGPNAMLVHNGPQCVVRPRQPDRMPRADRFPSRDFSGRMHGDVPSHVPRNWRRGEIQDAIAEVQGSLARRRGNMAIFGEEGGHRARIAQEEAWLRQLLRRLEDLR